MRFKTKLSATEILFSCGNVNLQHETFDFRAVQVLVFGGFTCFVSTSYGNKTPFLFIDIMG